ncbi:hypothetical protein TIFTF001_007224 [Ficus carica]|uniref:pectinesterase n=1 Tax=Ficus carica TaxID=3494 RepID=A0AA87ZJ20_FICCA|nr:hypothetical protein TIFTF001_007224 [Ficus carica]
MYNLSRKTKLSLSISILTGLLFISISQTHEYFTNTSTEAPIHLHFHKHNQIALSACEGTLYPDLCVSTVASFPDLTSKSLPQIISSTVSHTLKEVKASSTNCSVIERSLAGNDSVQKRALDDCLELLDDTIAELNDVVFDLSSKKSASRNFHDLQTLLSAAITNQYTCVDGFNFATGNKYVRGHIQDRILTISNHVSNILVMVNKIKMKAEDVRTRKLSSSAASEVFPEYGRVKKGFPTWVSSKDRRMLQSAVNETKYDLVVAKDGTGNFTTVGEAVEAAPNNSDTR